MNAPYFIWKGISSIDKKIIVTRLPDIERADSNAEKIAVPGRDGFLIDDDGTYQGTVKPVQCKLDDGDINDIASWLTGTNEVVFSNEPDYKYSATIINKIPFIKVVPILHDFIILFDCQPHKGLVANDVITLTVAGSITNPSAAYSKPIIKIYGTGDVVVTINSVSFTIKGVNAYATVNSEIEDCYKDTTSMNNSMEGEFPKLAAGVNSISWTGTVTKLEITPNWRWL